MKTIRRSQVVRTWNGHCRVGDIVIFDVLGAAPRGSGVTEASAFDLVRLRCRAELYMRTVRIAHQTRTVGIINAFRSGGPHDLLTQPAFAHPGYAYPGKGVA